MKSFNRSFSTQARAITAQAAIIFAVPALLAMAGVAQAQAIFRCPSAQGITTYTNDKLEAGRLGCSPMTGGNITVIEGTKVQTAVAPSAAAPTPVRVATAPQAGSRIDGPEQRVRDSDSKAILESELKKAEAKQNEMLKEYNNGEPEKLGAETRNNQKYLDRVAELKAGIARNDSDIAGIRRELQRLPRAPANTTPN